MRQVYHIAKRFATHSGDFYFQNINSSVIIHHFKGIDTSTISKNRNAAKAKSELHFSTNCGIKELWNTH